MPEMIRSSVTSSAVMSSVSIVRPSRRIVIESAIAAISLSLCEMITQVMPSLAQAAQQVEQVRRVARR